MSLLLHLQQHTNGTVNSLLHLQYAPTASVRPLLQLQQGNTGTGIMLLQLQQGHTGTVRRLLHSQQSTNVPDKIVLVPIYSQYITHESVIAGSFRVFIKIKVVFDNFNEL